MKVFILEDDTDQSTLISHWLTEQGHTCESFTNGRQFIEKLPYDQPDLLLLDWNLPVMSGIEVLNWIRSGKYNDLLVIFITTRNHEDDLIRALDQGADDFLVKPVKQRELIARSKALYRRFSQNTEKQISTEPFKLNETENNITYLNKTIKLTAKEYELARFFLTNQDRLLSRDFLLEAIWAKASSITTRTVDTHVSRLRKKLELDGTSGWKLMSVYHKGYRLIKLEDSIQHGHVQ